VFPQQKVANQPSPLPPFSTPPSLQPSGVPAAHQGLQPHRHTPAMSSSYQFSDGPDEAALDFLLEPRPASGYTNIIRRLANYTGPVLPTPGTPMGRHGSPGRGEGVHVSLAQLD